MARSDRAVRALLERYLLTFPDEAARELEHLPLRDVVGLLQSHAAPVAGVAVAEANLGILARELGLPGTAARRFRAALAAASAAGAGAKAAILESPAFIESRALLA